MDVKLNAPRLLEKQTRRAGAGTIILSSVTDPYQPLEARYRVTRGCLEVLRSRPFPLNILTKSPLVLRDLDLLKTFDNLSVGITITTDSDAVRKVFEPGAPPIKARVEALKTLHENGISTYAFIGPVLPMDPEVLARKVRPYVDKVLIDGMNYPSKTKAVYRRQVLDEWLDGVFIDGVIERLNRAFGSIDVECC